MGSSVWAHIRYYERLISAALKADQIHWTLDVEDVEMQCQLMEEDITAVNYSDILKGGVSSPSHSSQLWRLKVALWAKSESKGKKYCLCL